MGFLAGKKLLITGVLSNRSIAYGIAKACHAQGAELAFSYVGERFKDRITEFAADFDSKLTSCSQTYLPTGPRLTALCTALALRHAKPLPVTFWMA
jgi:enoyl-[acyl-carrier-protein] reductase (NADH)